MATPQIEQPAAGAVHASSTAEYMAPELPVPTQNDVPLLSAGEYLKRFQAHETSLYKSLLVLLALFAFWLAIESNYARFNDLDRVDTRLSNARSALDKLNQLNARPLATFGNSDDPEPTSSDDRSMSNAEFVRALDSAIERLRQR